MLQHCWAGSIFESYSWVVARTDDCVRAATRFRLSIFSGFENAGTLADFDIVGRKRSGELVYAQCKGDPEVHQIMPDETEAFESLPDGKKFFFARHGVNKELPGVMHIDESEMIRWLTEAEAGREYFRLFHTNMVT